MNRSSSPSVSKPQKPSFIEKARRNQILETALKEIEAKGYQNTSIQNIADKAKISKGVIYYHFSTKEELLNSIWAALLDELFEFRKIKVENQPNAKKKLQVYFEANFEFLQKNFNKFIALFRMGIDLNATEKQPYPWSREINQRCFNYLSDILKEGQQSGEFRKFPTKIIAPIIQAAIDGLAVQWIASRDLFSLSECCQTLMEIIDQYTAKAEV